jgi:hypothetical protein
VGQGFWGETWEGRAELELDGGTLVRLGPQTLVELSDLTRLSTGQRISLLSLERGTLYLTGEPAKGDALVAVAPGLEVSFLAGSLVRIDGSVVAVIEGRVKLQAPSVEMELTEGQGVRLGERFELLCDAARTGQTCRRVAGDAAHGAGRGGRDGAPARAVVRTSADPRGGRRGAREPIAPAASACGGGAATCAAAGTAPAAPPVVERSIRLQNPEAGEMRSRRR